jgi:hypothetical protein
VAIGSQFGYALGGFAPAISAALAGPALDNWVPVAMFSSVTSVMAVIAVLTMRETYRTPLHELGRPGRRDADTHLPGDAAAVTHGQGG